ENIVTVVTDNKSRKDVIPTNQFLFPVYGGIYRPVHLITTNKTGFVVTDQSAAGIFIRQKNVSKKSAQISIEAKLETTEKRTQEGELVTQIRDYQGEIVKTQKTPVSISPQGVTYVKQ